ncbi:MAG: type II secretion system F family protein [Nanoarchaeota archaeon]
MKEIIRELYVFSKQYESINNFKIDKETEKDKSFLEEIIINLKNQLKILNRAMPALINRIGFYKELSTKDEVKKSEGDNLVRVRYKSENGENIEVIIINSDRDKFLENLSKSRLAIQKIKKDIYQNQNYYKEPGLYIKLSNKIFREFSDKLVSLGYFTKLNRVLRKINSRYVISSYVSMMFFSMLIFFFLSILLFLILLFLDISIIYPFISSHQEPFYLRFIKYFWIILAIPFTSGILFYFFPFSEAKNIGNKIDQELPFVTIHMSAIASSGLDPISIFKIILSGEDYEYTNIEFKKILNLINFHGESTANALRKISLSTPSQKLKELLNGLAVTITSGGELSDFLNQHSETMLFDYKLQRERSNKISETFMDIYISIAIAAPMILLMMFVIIGSTGLVGNFLNLSTNSISILLILSIVVLNIFFLLFLKIKQPTI